MRFKEFNPLNRVFGVFGKTWRSIERPAVSIVIPAFNEGKTLSKVISAARKTPNVVEIIVVDDGSNDDTPAIAKKLGVRLLRHRKNVGKGAAIKTGIKNAKNPVLLFLDADLEDITPAKILLLAEPVVSGQATFAKATFKRGEGGRITELAAKPLLEYLFPGFSLSEPLSGQFCATKSLLQKLEIADDWGVDIALVLDALESGEKITEVNIGSLKHKHRTLSNLSSTSRQVIKTILQRAGFFAKKHKLVILDFDNTLVSTSSIAVVAKKLGFSKQLAKLRKEFYSGRITERQLTHKIALLFKGKNERQLRHAAEGILTNPYAVETLTYLKRMGYKLAVVSYAFRRVVTSVFPQNFFDDIISPLLEEKNGVFTGKCSIPFPNVESGRNVFSKGFSVKTLARRYSLKSEEVIAVGDSTQDIEMFENAGLSVCINPSSAKVEKSASVRLNSLAELIVLAS